MAGISTGIVSSGTSHATLAANSTLGLKESPSSNIYSITEGRMVQVWQLVLGETMPAICGHQAIQVAWLKGMPKRGDQFRHIYNGASNGITSTGDSNATHQSLFAFEFNAATVSPIDGKRVWEIEIVYREPIFGADEWPVGINRVGSPDPILRKTEYNFDFTTVNRLQPKARKLNGETLEFDESLGGLASNLSELELVTNSAGLVQMPMAIPHRVAVMNLWFNTYDGNLSYWVNQYFDNTVNIDTFKLFGLVVQRYTARFLSITQEEVGWHNGTPYFRAHAQIMLAPTPEFHFVEFPSIDSVDSEGNPIVGSNGIPTGPVLLNTNGTAASGTDDPDIRRYLPYRARYYGRLEAGEIEKAASGWIAALPGRLS